MDRRFRAVVATALLCLGAPVSAGEYSFSSGAEYTEGDYGTGNDTSALYVPFTLGYRADRYGWSLTVPYLRFTGSGDITYSRTGVRAATQDTATSSGSGPGGGGSVATSGERTESGLGDTTLTGSYYFMQGAGPRLSVTGKIKFATADEEKNLGTGEQDYALQLEAGVERVYGYLGYLLIGDTDTVDYDDVIYGGIGADKPFTTWRIGAGYYAEQAALDGTDPVSEATFSAGRELGKDNWLNLYLIKGFSDSSPDWGVGVGLSHYF